MRVCLKERDREEKEEEQEEEEEVDETRNRLIKDKEYYHINLT